MPKRGVIGDDNIVGQRVVALRKEQKLKQKDLLARLQVRGLNLNQSSLSALEGQRRRVSDRELVVLASALGVEMEALVRKPGEMD
ncbi:helix-turn-helix transcriptional regulator [Oscillospiraceae bacterium 50-16]|nr:helix-turn-helix transcriptional regulator [Lawsonibacter sp.]